MIELATEHFIWCNICNAKPADGKLVAFINNEHGEPDLDLGEQVLDACKGCVELFASKDWYN